MGYGRSELFLKWSKVHLSISGNDDCREFRLQYFKNSLNTRLSIVYIETWKELNKVPGFGKLPNIKQALNDFSEYVGTRLYQVRVLS